MKTIEERLALVFPEVSPGRRPIGHKVIVQLKLAQKISAGGIIFLAEDVEIDQMAMSYGKIVALGPVAFRHKETGVPYHSAPWYGVGDIVTIPKSKTGDSWSVKHGDEEIFFALINDETVYTIVEDLSTVL